MTRLPPSVVSCGWPCTRVIPVGRPESSFVAKLPSVATTFGWISSICFQRWPSQAWISSGCGSRFPGGRHFSTFATNTSGRVSPIPASSLSSSFPAWPTKGTPCLSSWKPGASPTNIRSACGLPAPKTTCVRPCASRQRVQLAVATAYSSRVSTPATGTALTGASLRGTPDGHDARPPAAARSVHLDLVPGRLAEQDLAHGRIGRDATDARDLDLEPLAIVSLELDARADCDDAARRGLLLVDDRRVLEAMTQHPDPRLEQPLLVLRRVVLEVLGEVAVRPRGRERLYDLLPPWALELGELGLQLLVGGGRQQLALFVHPCHRGASGRSRRSRRSTRRRPR